MRIWNVWLQFSHSLEKVEVQAESFSIGDSGVLLFFIKGEVVAAFGKNSWSTVRPG